MDAIRGFFNIYKKEGMSSAAVVGKVKRCLNGKVKVGHMGTLDPCAEGVLPIAIGRATRLFDLLLTKDKRYIAAFTFGKTTDTLDKEGEIVQTDEKLVRANEVKSVLEDFVGEMEQLPPAYSAKSIGGKRAYELAREGKQVALAPKKITVYDLKLLSNEDIDALKEELSSPLSCDYLERLKRQITLKNTFAFDISCSSGTYIRSLARDIATKLGTVGYMSMLMRTKCGEFVTKDAIPIENLSGESLMPIDCALKNLASFELVDDKFDRVMRGEKVRFDLPKSPFKVTHEGEIVAIGEDDGGYLKLKVRLI